MKVCGFRPRKRVIICALKDGGTFERSFKEICPPELVLKKENVSNNEGSFLDLLIDAHINNQFSTQLYDDKDDFPFSVVRMPYLRSNIPSKLFYST